MSKTTRTEGPQPGVVEEMAMAIVNQMHTQRVVVGTKIKYTIRAGGKVYVMESAVVNDTNGWLMHIISGVGPKSKPGPYAFFSCPKAAADAVMMTLRANTSMHAGPFYLRNGDFALVEISPHHLASVAEQLQDLEAILRTRPAMHPVTK